MVKQDSTVKWEYSLVYIILDIDIIIRYYYKDMLKKYINALLSYLFIRANKNNLFPNYILISILKAN